jgi:DNA-binding MarR family transcriptional regulator
MGAPVGDDLTIEEFRSLAEFRRHIRQFLHFSETEARGSGVEPQQHQLLLAIKGLTEGDPTIGEIAETLQLQHHSAVELVNRAAERGLVRRVPVETDRRQVRLKLTRSGEAILRRLTVEHRRELESTGPALIKALNRILRLNRVTAA